MNAILLNSSLPVAARRARRALRPARAPAGMSVAPAAPEVDHAADIVAIAAQRDRAAFARLFAHFAPRVKTYLLRLGAAPALAEELAQETMLSVWRKAGLYDPARAGASTWIFTIARNLRLDAARSDRRRQLLGDALEPPEGEPEPDAILAAGQRDLRLREALVQLPPEQAEVIRHAFFHDKAHAQISAELGLPLGTVKSRLRLAIGRLRYALGDLTLGDLR